MLCLAAVLILLSPSLEKRPFNFIGGLGTDLFSRLQTGISLLSAGVTRVWKNYVSLGETNKENESLTSEVQRLQSQILLLQETALQNNRLQQLLELKSASETPLTAARVVGRDATNWYKTIMLNKGEQKGLQVGMGVLSPAGVVGKIIRTTLFSSQVLLVSDHRSVIAALVHNTRDEGLVEGAEASMLRMKYLPILSDVKEGEVVLTSGLAGIFPKGLVIGHISEVQKKKNDLFQVAYIKPAVDLAKLEEVMVIIQP